MHKRAFHHAVVYGGSMAGLLAARVLSDHFTSVTLIERDTVSPTTEPRKGVPQGAHGHVLLARGRMIMEDLFPGLVDELRAAGAVYTDTVQGLVWFHGEERRVSEDADMMLLTMSRPLLEATIARRMRQRVNVTVIEGTRITGLAHHDRRGVTGVHVRGGRDLNPGMTVEADLVVDATGRGSVTPRWLREINDEAPEEEHVPVPITYATCTFERGDDANDTRSIIVSGAPARRTGFVLPIEGRRWLASVGGFFDEPLPRTHDEFRAYVHSLPIPDLDAVIGSREPVSDVVRFRYQGSLRRRYERLAAPPAGLIVTGDAVCSFNPIYGQGMTVSAIEATLLDDLLRQAKAAGGIDAGFSKRWFRAIRSPVDAAWNAVLAEDFRFPEMHAKRPLHVRALQWYLDRINRATYHNPTVTDQFYRVTSFLKPPTALFGPRIIGQLLTGHGDRRAPKLT